MQNIEKNLTRIRQQISVAAERYHRNNDEITLLAVSKTKPAADIRQAYACGQTSFGENYLQDAVQKIETLADLDIVWHFIGPVQSNKTKQIALLFDWVHCVDRLKIAQRLSAQRPHNLAPLNLCIQVNLDLESSKSGITLAEVPSLAREISGLPGLRLRGLMAIPAQQTDFDAQCKSFRKLKNALIDLQQRGFDCDTLSTGMSNDLEAAIAEGSTLVRIGTAIFGERS